MKTCKYKSLDCYLWRRLGFWSHRRPEGEGHSVQSMRAFRRWRLDRDGTPRAHCGSPLCSHIPRLSENQQIILIKISLILLFM